MIDDYEFPVPQYLFLRRVLLHLLGFKTRQLLGSFHNNPETRNIPVLTAILRIVAFVALFGAAIGFGYSKQLLLYWIVPLLTVFVAVGYIKRVSEHYGTRHEGVLNETRTLIAPWWQLFLLAPWGLNYHLEHHLYPGITCFNLGKAHRILMTRPAYAESAHITYGYRGLCRELSSNRPGERKAAIEALELDRQVETPKAAA